MNAGKEVLPVKIISASRGGGSIAASLRTAAREIIQSRHVIVRMFIRDFVTQFRQKLLGYFWAVIAPLLGIVSFVFMNEAGFLNPGEIGYPYPLFVYVGTSIWGVMIATLGVVSGGLLGNSDLMLRTNIPPIALAIAGLAGIVYSVLVNTASLLLVLLITGFTPSPWAIFYPFLMIPAILAGTGIGLILAVIGTVARDVSSAVITLLGLAMYITPVIYVTEFEHPILRAVVTYNPIAYLVDFPRALVLQGVPTNWHGFLYSCGFVILLLCVGIHGFYLIKDKAAERL